MSARVEEAYTAYCPDCDWESSIDESQAVAQRAADRHNADEHGDESAS